MLYLYYFSYHIFYNILIFFISCPILSDLINTDNFLKLSLPKLISHEYDFLWMELSLLKIWSSYYGKNKISFLFYNILNYYLICIQIIYKPHYLPL